ncbi:DUF6477 family protein [Cognatishimia sp. 1_MG-2023]|uniref:DUF6477 family protein n=1 Tax=Cognatishimia sp. 1_MG-2023 TaxID=3062642 RepID=UPI0026E25868|nr:DUF6477 family protein [Cognatishimia sp. 1_MG-2023]MDO6725469.1 DUF6477 family protein [Cognatishimia sp. 1_MG-2023]
MQDVHTMLRQFNRPKLLVRAAKAAAVDYERPVHLARLLRAKTLPGHAEAIINLLELEHTHNEMRRQKHLGYSPIAHVDVMIAIVGEAQLMQASQYT